MYFRYLLNGLDKANPALDKLRMSVNKMSIEVAQGVMDRSELGLSRESFYEPEGSAIPIPLVRELIAFPEYGSKIARALRLLYVTGCRISELERMHFCYKHGNFILWRLGKNQVGMMRQEYLPPDLWKEIEYGMQRDRHRSDKICDLHRTTVLSYFNKEIRPHLSSAWREKIPRLTHQNNKLLVRYEYKYQLKGLRKTFSTLMFAYFWRKYASSEVALEKVSKRMKHNSKWMTMHHYIEMTQQIKALDYCDDLPFEHLGKDSQNRLGDFMHLPEHFMERKKRLG